MACVEEILKYYLEAVTKLTEYCPEAISLMSQILRKVVLGNMLTQERLFASRVVMKATAFVRIVEGRMTNRRDVERDVLREYAFLKGFVEGMQASIEQPATKDI